MMLVVSYLTACLALARSLWSTFTLESAVPTSLTLLLGILLLRLPLNEHRRLDTE